MRPPKGRVRLAGEFDLRTREHLADVVRSLRRCGCSVVEIDASRVTFVDASCLRLMHDEGRRLRGDGGELRVTAGSDVFVKLVRAAGYAELMPIVREGDRLAACSVPRQRASADDARPGSGRPWQAASPGLG